MELKVIPSRGSFRRQIILTFGVGFFVLISAFAAYLVLSEQNNLQRDSLNETTSMAQALAASARPWVLADDVAGLQEAVRAFHAYPEFSYAMVISPSGRVLAHSDPSRVGKYVTDEQSLALLKTPHVTRVMEDTPDTLAVAVPIEMGKQQVGWARVGSLKKENAGYLQDMILHSIIFLLFATALSFLAALVIANRLGRRVASLVSVAEAVQSGNYAMRVGAAAGEDEIVRLGNSLNRMLETLSENERDLRDVSRYTRSLIEASLDPLVTISAEGIITDVNRATEKATGLDRAKLIGTDFSEYFTEPGKARAGYRKVFAHGYVTDYPLTLRHHDGHTTDVLYNASLYRDEAGEVLGVFAAARDITERKRAEEVLRQSEKALKEAQRLAHMGSWHLDLATNQVYWSEELYKMYGYDPALPPPPYTESAKLFTPESWDKLSSAIARAAQDGIPYEIELEMVHMEGRMGWMLAIGERELDAQGKPVRVRGVAMDITERKRAEEAVRKSEAMLQTTMKILPVGLWVLDAKGQIVFSNDAAQQIWAGARYVSIDQIGEYKGWRVDTGTPMGPHDWAGVRAVEKGETILNDEIEIECFDGTHKFILDSAVPVRNGDGSILNVITVNQDITERKKLETQLRQSSVYTRSLIEASLDPLVTISPEGKITDVNAATEKATGLKRGELVGTDFSDYFTEPDKARAGYKQAFEQGYVTDYPLALRHKDGHLTDVLYNVSLYRDEAGKVLGVFAAARDVTERKRAEDALYEAQEVFRSLVENSPDIITRYDRDLRRTYVNPTYLKTANLPQSSLIGVTPAQVSPLPPEGAAQLQKLLRSVIDTGMVAEIDVAWPREDNIVHWYNIFAFPEFDRAGRVMSVMTMSREITERKLAENELREKEERLTLATLINGVGIWDWNLKTQQMIWDDSMYALYHIRREDFIGTEEAWRKSLHPDDLERGDREVADAIAGIKPFDTDFRVVWPDGQVRYIKAVAKVFRDEQGNPARMLGTNLDFTERKLVEMELEKLNSNFVTLLENTGDFIYFKDHDSRFIFCSQTLASITGHKSWRDMIGKHDLEVFPPDTARVYYEEELPVFRDGQPLRNKIDPYYDEQGNARWVSTNKWPVFGEDGKTVVGLFGISHDITELKNAEDKINELNLELERRVIERTAQLQAANHELEAFSYSVSHDLRSPLRAIDGFSNILLEDYSAKLDDEGKRLVGIVRENTIRMARLIDDILAFSRLGRKEMTQNVVDMAQLANETAAELAASWEGRTVKLEIGMLPVAHGDAAMLRQVWVNLFSNAIKFTRTREVARIEVSGHVEGSEIVYCVKDNGVGFDMQFADKLFGVFSRLHSVEEFEGTGAGLAIVKRIVSRHGGRVWADAKLNEGAAFYFALPAHEVSDESA